MRTSKLAHVALSAVLALSFSPIVSVQQAFADGTKSTSVALANQKTVFSIAEGKTSGSSISCGTTLFFKVVSEPLEGGVGTVQVGDGSTMALDASYAGKVVIPETVDYDGVEYKVVAVAANAFALSKLSSVVVPDTVMTLGKRCFYGCASLNNVDLGASSQLENIYEGAFCMSSNNGALARFYFPSRLKWVGSDAFNGQVALKSLKFNCEYVDYMGARAFANCTGLATAEIPGLTAGGAGLDFRTFCNCSNLETVIFRGSVLKEAAGAALNGDTTLGTRTFEECPKLKTVVYRGKKYIPSWGSFTGGGSYSSSTFYSSDPVLYPSIDYYASESDAKASKSRIGSVCLRAGTKISDVRPGMATRDADGVVVYDGAVPELPNGYTGWAYEGSAALSDELTDSLYAYPVTATDLRYATLDSGQEAYDFTATQIVPRCTLRDASGKLLVLGKDYKIEYQRKAASGWTATDDLKSAGRLRAVATALPGSGYTGSIECEFDIKIPSKGSVFTRDGLAYCVIEPASEGHPGRVSVGDGVAKAIDPSFAGRLTIPESVSPQGSLLEYSVVSIADYAFGGASAAESSSGLTGVDLPQTLQSIGVYAFGFCASLQDVSVPAGVRTISARAFDHCARLSELSFQGDTVDSLGTYAFASCSALKQLELPGIVAMADHVFANCSMLHRVDFKGAIPADNGATCFVGCGRLSRVVCYAQAYPSALPKGVALYYPIAFLGDDGSSLGQALVTAQTAFSGLAANMGAPTVLEGAVPALPKGFKSWKVAEGNATKVTGPAMLKPSVKPVATLKKVTINVSKVTAKAVSNAKNAQSIVLGPKVKDIAKGAFRTTKATKLVLKTSKLSMKTTSGCLAGSRVKTIALKGIAVQKKKALYKKCFGKTNCGKEVSLR